MKATLRVDIKGDDTTVAFDFDLADDADRGRFVATCGLLAPPEVTDESRASFPTNLFADDGIFYDVYRGKIECFESCLLARKKASS